MAGFLDIYEVPALLSPERVEAGEGDVPSLAVYLSIICQVYALTLTLTSAPTLTFTPTLYIFIPGLCGDGS